jgi:hypothetical protein
MAITSSQSAKLTKMNRAAKDVVLGTLIQGLQTSAASSAALVKASGSYVATAADASNAKIAITTSLTAVSGFLAEARRSGSPLALAVFSGSVAGTIVAIKDPTTTGSAIAAGDVVTYFAF